MISVCMAYYDRQMQLNKSLAAYRRLYKGLEISICDDGSPNPVVAPGCIVTTLPKKEFCLCPVTPINKAVNTSHGDYIVITNPEVEHKEPVLEQMREVINDDDDYVIAACQEWDGKWLSHSTESRNRRNRAPYPEGSDMHYCVMLTRSLWDRSGGFDESFREGAMYDDNDWVWTLKSVGANFIMRDDLVTYAQKHQRSNWVPGGQKRNKAIFEKKWGHLWSLS